MSFEYYSKWWAATKENLNYLVGKDADMMKSTKRINKRPLANQLVGGMYSKYCMIVQELGILLDQMAQPQKRVTVRKLMDAASIRLNELNEELRTIDISEFHYIDGALIELKLVPQDIEILDPIFYYLRHYTVEELWTKIKNGEKIYVPPPEPEPEPEEENLDPDAPPPPAPEAPPPEVEPPKKTLKKPVKKFALEKKELTDEEKAAQEKKELVTKVVKIIQTNERGRQARLYFFEKNKDFLVRKLLREGKKPAPPPTIEVQENATLQIQKLWRGHCARQLVRRKHLARKYLIGMVEPSWRSYEEFEKMEANFQIRRDLRDLRIKEYIEAHLSERARVFRVVGPRLMEDISDEIREWFYQWYTQVKNFDKYPTEEQGGTVIVVRGETFTPKEWLDEVERKRREKVKDKGKDKAKLKAEKAKQKKLAQDKKKKEKEKLKKEIQRKRKKRMQPQNYDMEFEPTFTVAPFANAFTEHQVCWDWRKDADNPEERHFMDIIHEEKCYEMQLELRQQVDELMRLELELLEAALAKDRHKKVKKKKKKKKKKGKKGRKKKDITASRTTEDLFQELVDQGIIHSYPKGHLSDYRGDFSYNNWEMRNRDFDPAAVQGDIRQAVKINCILPLSTEAMKKPRSVLIVGPRQCGKHVLANAVFNETQCVLFDLSPEILAGKYPGGKGMKMLLHLISKMSRILQPAIIYFEGAERVFYKKVPKPEKILEPTRMGKKLVKGIIKTIKPEDRVMVFGITGKPWLAKPAKIKKAFERIIFIPRTDYGTVYLYWRELLMPYPGVDRNIDVSCLAKLTKYFTLPDIKKAVTTVLSARRIVQLSYNPLRAAELYEALINVEPVTDKEYAKQLKLYNKTPLAKERKIFNKFADLKREQEAKANEKMKNKGKK